MRQHRSENSELMQHCFAFKNPAGRAEFEEWQGIFKMQRILLNCRSLETQIHLPLDLVTASPAAQMQSMSVCTCVCVRRHITGETKSQQHGRAFSLQLQHTSTDYRGDQSHFKRFIEELCKIIFVNE